MTDSILPAAPDRDDALTLNYEGTDIRRRGLQLNLTDMWRAAGSPDYRRPSLWLDMEETKRFRRYAQWRWPELGAAREFNITHDDIKPAEPDGLVTKVRGRRGETWAHWQLALAYARYLSPAFHAWCNSVVRTVIERFGAPIREEDGLFGFFQHEFDQLHRRLDAINRHHADQMFLLVSAQDLMLDQRRDFSARSRALMCAVIDAEPYEGQCPCCNAARVLTADQQPLAGATFDHFFHRSLNRPEHGWLICPQCHSELTIGGYLVRFAKMPEFRCFQSAVLAARLPPGKASRAPALSRPPRPRTRPL